MLERFSKTCTLLTAKTTHYTEHKVREQVINLFMGYGVDNLFILTLQSITKT